MIARGPGSKKIVFSLAYEVGWRLPNEGGLCIREMGSVVSGKAGVIVGEIGTDQLAVDALEELICFAI